LVWGANDTVFILDLCLLSTCFVRFIFYFFWVGFVVLGLYFIIKGLLYFIFFLNIITLNGRSIIMTFLFASMSLLFMGFASIISSLTVLYSDDYTGRFIMVSVITDIYNKKTKGPALMELYTATGKLKSFFFFFFDN